jgi:hypothetical protein
MLFNATWVVAGERTLMSILSDEVDLPVPT